MAAAAGLDRVVHHIRITAFDRDIQRVLAEEVARRNRTPFGASNAAQDAES